MIILFFQNSLLSLHHPVLINQTKRPYFIKFLFSFIHEFIKLIVITFVSQIKWKSETRITFHYIDFPCLATMISCSILIINLYLCMIRIIIISLVFKIVCKINLFTWPLFLFMSANDFLVFIFFCLDTEIIPITLFPIFENIFFIMRYTFLNQMRIKKN